MAGHDLIRLMHSLFLPVASPFPEVLWRPATDVYRTPEGWLLKFEVAGVRPEDIEVCVSDSVLTVRGVRRDCLRQRSCECHLMEIAYSHFERSMSLPCDLAQARITNEHEHGMLVVHIETEKGANHDD